MEKKNSLRWNPTKYFMENGEKFKIVARVNLDDDCNNKHADFSITCSIYRIRRNGSSVWCRGGSCHEEIVKRFPELERFIPLHLCDHLGVPMFPIENGIYHIDHSNPQTAMTYLRVTEDEFLVLSRYTEEKEYFKFLLFDMGIVARWKQEADEFIKFLEEKCGYEWVNPYTQEEERFHFLLTEEEINSVRKMVIDGCYTATSIAERRQTTLEKEIAKYRAEIEAKYDAECLRARTERDIKRRILDCGLSLRNVIYYPSRGEVHFNWKSYEKMITKEQFDEFAKNNDGYLGVTFYLDNQKQN